MANTRERGSYEFKFGGRGSIGIYSDDDGIMIVSPYIEHGPPGHENVMIAVLGAGHAAYYRVPLATLGREPFEARVSWDSAGLQFFVDGKRLLPEQARKL